MEIAQIALGHGIVERGSVGPIMFEGFIVGGERFEQTSTAVFIG